MAKQASWWNPANGADDGVVRHAPDDTQYFYPDGRQVERMRAGFSRQTVIIPRGLPLNDGRSMAFDGSKAGVVHVDPDAPDGGAVVDLAGVSKRDMNRAVSSSRYPHEAFYMLGTAPGDEGEAAPPPRYNPHVGAGYVVPASDQQGRQVWGRPEDAGYGNYQMAYRAKEEPVLPAAPQLPPAYPQAQPQPQAQSQPQQQAPATQVAQPAPYSAPPAAYQQPWQQQPPPYQQPFYPAPPPPPALDPNLQNVLGQVLQGMRAISERVGQIEQGGRPGRSPRPPQRSAASVPAGGVDDDYDRPTPIGRAPRRKPADGDGGEDKSTFEDDAEEIGARKGKPRRPGARFQHLDDYLEEEDAEQHLPGIIVGFEQLKIGFVNGPKPLKPRKKVYFDFGATGKQAASYHDVIESLTVVVLVYDTRYEEGTQFEPPDLGDERLIELNVPSLKKTFKVGSIGQSFTLGVFDCVVLVKVEPEKDLDYEE